MRPFAFVLAVLLTLALAACDVGISRPIITPTATEPGVIATRAAQEATGAAIVPTPTATIDPGPTQTRAAELAQLATLTAPTVTPTPNNSSPPATRATEPPATATVPTIAPTSVPTIAPTPVPRTATPGFGNGVNDRPGPPSTFPPTVAGQRTYQAGVWQRSPWRWRGLPMPAGVYFITESATSTGFWMQGSESSVRAWFAQSWLDYNLRMDIRSTRRFDDGGAQIKYCDQQRTTLSGPACVNLITIPPARFGPNVVSPHGADWVLVSARDDR